MIYVDPLWLLAIQAMPYVSIYVAFIHATSVGYLSPNTKITLSQCRTAWHVSSPCAVWLSAIPNRLRLNRVTRKDFVFRVTFNTMCSIIVVLWLSAFINSCYAQRRCVSVMYSTQIPWLQHKFRFVVVRWLSATTIRLRLNRATREDYVFRVTVNTMCSVVVVRSVHVSNMIMR